MALQMKKTDQNTTETKWVAYDDDTKVLLARIDNPGYVVALERERRKLRSADAQFEHGQVGVVVGETTENQTQCKLFSQFIVKDWTGVKDADGNPLDFSPDICEQLLNSNLEFFLFVLASAGNAALEAQQALAETVGKSLPASSGKKSGAGTQKSAD
ncbi:MULTISPECIES: hypothetical protein [Pseudomonas]|uniref:Tail assembly chaperone n=1 Tax=Pseudomonas rustica TaxID=2827099 RepID=A0ABS5N469_9PSED|nr:MULTISPECIES: hypothetical protein [Pseudomonas]MBS4081360.1 hypothetical protein [Pseudomonas rustica]